MSVLAALNDFIDALQNECIEKQPATEIHLSEEAYQRLLVSLIPMLNPAESLPYSLRFRDVRIIEDK